MAISKTWGGWHRLVGSAWKHFWLSWLGLLLVSTGWRPGMLLNILQCTGQIPTTKNYLAKTSLVLMLRNPGLQLSHSKRLSQDSTNIKQVIVLSISIKQWLIMLLKIPLRPMGEILPSDNWILGNQCCISEGDDNPSFTTRDSAMEEAQSSRDLVPLWS